jgi:hypothetical protein
MSTSGVPGPAPGSRTPPRSDPAVRAGVLRLDDWTIPTRNLAYLAEGRIGPTTWTGLVRTLTESFAGLDLDVVEDCSSRYDSSVPQGPGSIAGYRWQVGEGDQRCEVKSTTWTPAEWESFVVTVQLWVAPPLPKGTEDSPVSPHEWAVRVRAGEIRTKEIRGGRGGPNRQFRSVLTTDGGYAWIPASVLS